MVIEQNVNTTNIDNVNTIIKLGSREREVKIKKH